MFLFLLNMKNAVLLICLIGISISLKAQKYDYNWVMGAATIVDTFPLFEIISVIHNESGLEFDTIPMHGRYRLNSCSTTWSDAEGNLKYYSNGKAVYNTAGMIM